MLVHFANKAGYLLFNSCVTYCYVTNSPKISLKTLNIYYLTVSVVENLQNILAKRFDGLIHCLQLHWLKSSGDLAKEENALPIWHSHMSVGRGSLLAMWTSYCCLSVILHGSWLLPKQMVHGAMPFMI